MGNEDGRHVDRGNVVPQEAGYLYKRMSMRLFAKRLWKRQRGVWLAIHLNLEWSMDQS